MPIVLSAVAGVMIYLFVFYRLAKREDWLSCLAMLVLPISIILMLMAV